MTDQPSVCVITPTIGRPTLKRCLESAPLDDNDLWLVIYDFCHGGSPLRINEIVDAQGTNLQPYHSLFNIASTKNEYGNHGRDMAMGWCQDMGMFKRDYFLFLDDDDIFVPGAIEVIKREIARHHPRPIMFRMINGNGETLWRHREVTPGNVGGSMFCCPNIKGKVAKWSNGAGHRSDYEFIRGTLERYGEGWRQHIVWSDEVIVRCRPGD